VTGRRAHVVTLATILAGGAALRLWGVGFGLPHPLCRPDEEVIISMARGFFSGDYNPHFFEWPSFYFYVVHALLRIVYAVGYLAGTYPNADAFVKAIESQPGWGYLLTRNLSVASGVLTLLVTHSIVKALFDRTTALLAAAFLAVAFLHVRDSHFGVLEAPLTLVIMLSMRQMAFAWLDRRRVWHLGLAGITAGLAASVKYNAAALFVAALAAAVLTPATSGSPMRIRDIGAGLTAFAGAFVIAFLVGTPYAVLDYEAFRKGVDAQVVRLTQGHGIQIERVWLTHLTFSLRYGVGLPVLLAAAIGMLTLALNDWRKAALLWSFPLAYFIVIGSGHTAFVRYTTPLVPFLCIGAAVAARQVLATVRHREPRVQAILAAVLVAILAGPSVSTVAGFNRLLGERDTRLLAADWLRGRLLPDQSLYESGSSYVRPHYAWPSGTLSYEQVEFDERRGAFVTEAGVARVPDWLVIAESPLRLYTPVPPALRGILGADYQLMYHASATRAPERETWFDRQDAFFLPYANFTARERPGPDLSIYRRTTQP
jgi:Dolichyl-phosphate-mannose-protein mannosyltransferase